MTNGRNYEKNLKKILIFIAIIFSIFLIDTFYAIIFNKSPILKIREKFNGENIEYIDRGLFINHFYCSNKEEKTLLKNFNYKCQSLYSIQAVESNTCKNEPELYYILSDTRKIYTYCLDSIKINSDNNELIELKDYLNDDNDIKTIEGIINHLEFIDEVNDGGSKIYKDYATNHTLTLVSCNTLENSKDIYIGSINMKNVSEICKTK